MKHTNLEHMITEFNQCETVDSMFEFVEKMIDSYTAGKKEQHMKSVNKVRYNYQAGLDSKAAKERYAKRELSRMVGNVCLEMKVI